MQGGPPLCMCYDSNDVSRKSAKVGASQRLCRRRGGGVDPRSANQGQSQTRSQEKPRVQAWTPGSQASGERGRNHYPCSIHPRLKAATGDAESGGWLLGSSVCHEN